MNTRHHMNLVIIVLTSISALCSSSGSPISSQENEQDKTALLALKHQFVNGGGGGSALASWNNSLHFCQWEGIACGKRHQRVVQLKLTELKLDGTLSPSVGNLTFLRVLSLHENLLHGELPTQLGYLWRLQSLNLSTNLFQGGIPSALGNCSNLVILDLAKNNLAGKVPFELGSLVWLTEFRVDRNQLVGGMPNFLRNLSSLNLLALHKNSFSGEIGDSLRGLSKLNILSISHNDFSGSILGLYNLSSLVGLHLGDNNFTGSLAQDIGVAFQKATYLNFYLNDFSGPIPTSVSNISSLEEFEISYNRFSGLVPDTLGKLTSLWNLQLGDNLLGGKKSGDMSFIDSLANCTSLKYLDIMRNRFGGRLPDSIANLTLHLQSLAIQGNYITGPIPEGIGELVGLTTLSLHNNLLSGAIPTSIGKLTKISLLRLNTNKLQGEIPYSLGNLTNLLSLYLYESSLDGKIPHSLGNCKHMQFLDIEDNRFTDNLPDDVFSQFQGLISCGISYNFFNEKFSIMFGKLKALNFLYASHNKFYGEIPAQLGESTSLVSLKLSGNLFTGSIPESLHNLRGLEVLDLSSNNLSGRIPKQLSSMILLRNLNLSFNQLEGEVPFFKNASAVSLEGNIHLCGGNQEMNLLPCVHHLTMKIGKSPTRIAIAISVSVITSFALFILLFIICGRRKYSKERESPIGEGYQRITYTELSQATMGFAGSNLIGAGSFGEVYKGSLDQNKIVAVKVLNLSKHGATKSFSAECKVLKNIRHRNLLKIITACSSLDYKGNDFKALVYVFMSNGNLDSWLHFGNGQPETRVLTLEKRLDIAIDVGSALNYLHNGCETPIVHCDLKPNNILLDDDMVAHVGDFGLARLLVDDSGKSKVMTTAMKGSIGYIAPEYGMGEAVSPQGDIYSYGILLLELITGKRPTDDMFSVEMSLLSFCEGALPNHAEVIADVSLMHELREAVLRQRNPEKTKLQCQGLLDSFVEVGISCAARSSKDRMDIKSALRCLEGIKQKWVSICARSKEVPE